VQFAMTVGAALRGLASVAWLQPTEVGAFA
jgi:hypothetical protein